MEKTAVIIGATGAVGKEILKEILADNFYNKVYILGRESIGKLGDEERLTKIIVDFENLNFDTSILEECRCICKSWNNDKKLQVQRKSKKD